MTDVLIDARRGAGSSLEILYGTVTWKPTLTHSRGTSIVLPAPTTFDLVDGQVVATNVQPTPEPVAGQVEWAYEVTFKDRHSKSYSFLVGVPDSTSQVNFISLPRYFETKPPLFGQGEQGIPGESATVAVGTVTSGTTPNVTNSGTNTDAILNFTLPKGDKGDTGVGVPAGGSALQVIRKNAGNTATEWATLNKASVGLSAVDNTSDADKPVSVAQKSYIDQSDTLPYRSRLAVDSPLEFPVGISVFMGDTRDGWPSIEDPITAVTIVTLRTQSPTAVEGTVQYAYPTYNVQNKPLWRVYSGTSGGAWGDWQSNFTSYEGESLRRASTVQTALNFKSTPEGIIYSTLTTNNTEPTPGMLQKRFATNDTPGFGVNCRPVRETLKSLTKRVGAGIAINASGYNTTTGEIRGPQIFGGVDYHDFEDINTSWIGTEAVGITKTGEIKYYSQLAGDTIQKMLDDGVVDSWSFGPIIVKDGVARDLSDPRFASAVTGISARQIFGTTASGAVKIITTSGASGSEGLDLNGAQQLALQEGLVDAISLDGGGSAQTMAEGIYAMPSSDAGGERTIPDALIIAAPLMGVVDTGWFPATYEAGYTHNSTPIQVRELNGRTYLKGDVKPVTGKFGASGGVVAITPRRFYLPSGINVSLSPCDGSVIRKTVVLTQGRIQIANTTDGSEASYVDLSSVTYASQ